MDKIMELSCCGTRELWSYGDFRYRLLGVILKKKKKKKKKDKTVRRAIPIFSITP